MTNLESPAHVYEQTNESTDASVSFYEQELVRRTTGPQLEGLDAEWVKDALSDPATKILAIQDDQGASIQWPLFVAVSHDENYSQDFFSSRYGNEKVYSMTLPPAKMIDSGAASAQLDTIFTPEDGDHLKLAVCYRNGSSEQSVSEQFIGSLVQQSDYTARDVTPVSKAFGDEFGLPSVSHFMATVRTIDSAGVVVSPDEIGDTAKAFSRLVERGAAERSPQHGPTILSIDDLRRDDGHLLDVIWDMYNAQFSELVEDHPSLQKQSKDELIQMLLDQNSMNVAFMEDGRPVSLCYFVDPRSCVWLNDDYFAKLEQQDQSLKTLYFPGLVVEASRARQGNEYAGAMIKLASSVLKESGAGFRITFQCTNVSETYIPGIITHLVTKDNILRFDQEIDASGSAFSKVARYDYRILSLDRKDT